MTPAHQPTRRNKTIPNMFDEKKPTKKTTADEPKLVFETPHTSRLTPTSKNRPVSSSRLVCSGHSANDLFMHVSVFRNQLYHETGFVQELSLDIILNGDNGLSHQNNTILHQAVTTFIKSTKRFRLTR